MPPTSTMPQPKSLKMAALTVVFASSLLLADGKPGWYPAAEVQWVGRVDHDLAAKGVGTCNFQDALVGHMRNRR